ncbi:MAG: helix-turn-helix domain-containing protein [Clostridia bacterium]|nr:helix-turn-helix domain-containing protein [Clostridia bacterium]
MNKSVTPARKFLIDRLGIIRARAGLSARELSGRIGKSKAYIAKFDNGDLAMPSEVLLDAIQVCGSSPEEFFFDDIASYKEAKELFEIYKVLSSENKARVVDLMKNLK